MRVNLASAHSVLNNRVAAHVKDAIKAYEQTTSLPYDNVPQEVCRPKAGTKSIDLSSWSMLVNDAALRCIATEDREHINNLARKSSVSKVGFISHGATAVGATRCWSMSRISSRGFLLNKVNFLLFKNQWRPCHREISMYH